MAPGIQKLNIPKATTSSSPKAAIANNLRSTTGTSGAAYGIFAQRSKVGMGLHLNNKLYGSASVSATRHALNDNRVALFNNIGMPHVHKHSGNDNTMNKFMAGMMALNMLGQLTAQTVDAVKSAKTANASGNTDAKSSDWEKQFKNDKLPLTSELKSATSFKGINTVENKVNTQLKDFQANYSKETTTTTTAITNALDANIQATLTELGVTIDSSKLKASTLNINVDDLSTLDTASQTIDKDIQTATKFLNTDITQAISKLESGLGEATANLTSLEQQKSSIEAKPENMRTSEETKFLQEYESKHQALQDKKDKIQNALDAMNGQNGVKSLVEGLIKTLGDKKANLADIKQTKADMADKKYQVAEQLQKDITKTQKQMDNLESKISKAKTDDEKNKLIKEFNGLVQNMEGFKTEVDTAGKDPIKNSKGKPISFSEIDSKYLTKKTEQGESSQQQVRANTVETPMYTKAGNLDATSDAGNSGRNSGIAPWLQEE